MTTTFLDGDQALMQTLPDSVQARGADFPMALVQAAKGQGIAPLPKDYEARCIEVYLNGTSEAAAVFHGDQLIAGDVSALMNSTWSTLVLEIDGTFRYCQINGIEALNTLGDFELPSTIIPASTEVEIMIDLLTGDKKNG